MAKRKKKENTFLGEYEIKRTLKEDSIYQYIEAIDSMGKSVLLQVLRATKPLDVLERVRSYFDKLIALNADNILKPDLLLQFSPTSLTLVYTKLPVGTALVTTGKDLDNALDYWYQASECLHAIHNRRICHGLINHDSFIVFDDKVYLKGFGYVPLIEIGHKGAIKECGDFLLAQVLSTGNITQSSDIYSFARTIAIWEPRIIEGDWYIKATHPEPSKRYGRIRDAFSELEVELKRLFGIPEEVIETDNGSMSVNGSGSNLLPKYEIHAVADPLEAGVIDGAGYFKKDEIITITASANDGWEFEKWSGDIESNKSSVLVVVDGNKKISASFKINTRIVPRLNVNVVLEPVEAGEVRGMGSFIKGETVNLIASASDGWTFSGWSGDINSSRNPIKIIADADKDIIANFTQVVTPVQVQTGTLVVKLEPPEAGKVIGGGTCVLGQCRTIMAIPSEGWEFSEWSGDASSKINPLKVIVDSNKIITGKFIVLRTFKVIQTSNPPEAGIVVVDRHSPSNSQERILARAADPVRWKFSHWSGDIQGSTNPTKLLINADKSIVANFIEITIPHIEQESDRIPTPSSQKPAEEELGKAFQSNSGKEEQSKGNVESSKSFIGQAFTQTSVVKENHPSNLEKEKKVPKLGNAFKV